MSEHEADFGNNPEDGKKFTWQDLDSWNTKGYSIEKYGEEPSVFLLGELHYNENDMSKQVELIRKIEPDYILHEFLNGWYYDPLTKEYKEQSDRHFSGYDSKEHIGPSAIILECADELKIPIIGCDLTEGEVKWAEMQLLKNHPDLYEEQEGSGILINKKNKKAITTMSPEMNVAREERMVKTILQYQKRSSKPLVVIIGSKHSEAIHQNRQMQEKGFGYVYVDQSKAK